MAHELAHVVQQNGEGENSVFNEAPAHEKDAANAAGAIANGSAVKVAESTSVGIALP